MPNTAKGKHSRLKINVCLNDTPLFSQYFLSSPVRGDNDDTQNPQNKLRFDLVGFQMTTQTQRIHGIQMIYGSFAAAVGVQNSSAEFTAVFFLVRVLKTLSFPFAIPAEFFSENWEGWQNSDSVP